MPSSLQAQDYTFSASTSRGPWRWVTRVDVSSSAPRYEVRDIVSPYGILRDSIPIPGEVITAMAQSIANLGQTFAPHMLSSTGLTFTLDEGRGFGPAQTMTVTNDGSFGSLLRATLATSASWLTTDPVLVGGLGQGQTASVQVAASSSLLVAAQSPYTATVTLQDPNATNTPLVVPITVIVRPKATLALSDLGLSFFAVRPVSGAFSPVPSQGITLTNTGPSGSVLVYTIQRLTNCAPWLASIMPMTGTLASGASQLIAVTVAPPPDQLTGTFTETLRISGYSTNSYQDVTVTLTVT